MLSEDWSGWTLGELVRRHRSAARLTQEELAEKAGVSSRTVQGIETGRVRRPHATSLRLLAAALCLTASDAERFVVAARSGPLRPAGTAGRGSPSTVEVLLTAVDGTTTAVRCERCVHVEVRSDPELFVRSGPAVPPAR